MKTIEGRRLKWNSWEKITSTRPKFKREKRFENTNECEEKFKNLKIVSVKYGVTNRFSEFTQFILAANWHFNAK